MLMFEKRAVPTEPSAHSCGSSAPAKKPSELRCVHVGLHLLLLLMHLWRHARLHWGGTCCCKDGRAGVAHHHLLLLVLLLRRSSKHWLLHEHASGWLLEKLLLHAWARAHHWMATRPHPGVWHARMRLHVTKLEIGEANGLHGCGHGHGLHPTAWGWVCKDELRASCWMSKLLMHHTLLIRCRRCPSFSWCSLRHWGCHGYWWNVGSIASWLRHGHARRRDVRSATWPSRMRRENLRHRHVRRPLLHHHWRWSVGRPLLHRRWHV
mmetsp:Transcript_23551/g.42492  ORF Transcript_23551/g.42492 Transcript_23551/m.42492 type:complete len:265 (+) Transcript_23551:37-831(+)